MCSQHLLPITPSQRIEPDTISALVVQRHCRRDTASFAHLRVRSDSRCSIRIANPARWGIHRWPSHTNGTPCNRKVEGDKKTHHMHPSPIPFGKSVCDTRRISRDGLVTNYSKHCPNIKHNKKHRIKTQIKREGMDHTTKR